MDIEGAVALVTGAGSGIGRATARRLARDGAMLGVNDIDEARALESVRLIEQEGGRAMPISADVANEAMCGRCSSMCARASAGWTSW